MVQCDDSCATCATLDNTYCLSCYGASIISNGVCVGCADANALQCPKNVNYATLCIVGYTPITGVCKACASNC